MRENLNAPTAAALAQCRTMISAGSKSFSLAARLFPRETRDAAFFLYGWCRYCDDEIDERRGDTAGRRAARLAALSDGTRSALAGEPQRDPVFLALGHVASRYRIPAHYPLELIEGMAMDARGDTYETLEDLLLYCYRVAGTVGLMMAHVMGVSDERALKNAAHLGIAMQLTNIVRDIVADADAGRIYLPRSWLAEAGIAAQSVAAPRHRAALARVARRALTEAERYYRSADVGVTSLSFRCAVAVGAARYIYSDIGTLVSRRGPAAWDERVFTPRRRKLAAVGRGVALALRPGRLFRSASPAPIARVWRFPDVSKII
jgi:15-cis-phytoene synthase